MREQEVLHRRDTLVPHPRTGTRQRGVLGPRAGGQHARQFTQSPSFRSLPYQPTDTGAGRRNAGHPAVIVISSSVTTPSTIRYERSSTFSPSSSRVETST